MRAWVHGWLDIVELRSGLRLERVSIGLAGISLGGLPGARAGWGDLPLMWPVRFGGCGLAGTGWLPAANWLGLARAGWRCLGGGK